jgi:mRNA-degrading endonuclease RelE of RelBE toxin-antitoxin system
MQVVASRNYERRAQRLLSPQERAVAEAEIISRPEAWPVIQGTGGARKARIAMRGRGKRGGGRIIYFYSSSLSLLALLDIYAKGTKEDLTQDDKKGIRAAIQEIRAALR